MIPYEYYAIDLMQLEVFLKCAEYCNFTKAAKALNISTSMVSKRVSALETTLGAPLFIREKNRVSLSSSGEQLHRELTGSISAVIAAFNNAKRREKGQERPLVFGLSTYTNVSRYFIPLLNDFESVYQDVPFKFKTSDKFDWTEELLAGWIDVFFAPLFMREALSKNPMLEMCMIAPSPLYACMNINSPLAQCTDLDLSDLRETNFLFPQDSPEADEYMRWINQLCSREGYIPKKGAYFSDMVDVLLNLHEDEVYLTDGYYHDFQANYVVFKEVRDTESGLMAVWKKDGNVNALRFAEYAKGFYESLKTGGSASRP